MSDGSTASAYGHSGYTGELHAIHMNTARQTD